MNTLGLMLFIPHSGISISRNSNEIQNVTYHWIECMAWKVLTKKLNTFYIDLCVVVYVIKCRNLKGIRKTNNFWKVSFELSWKNCNSIFQRSIKQPRRLRTAILSMLFSKTGYIFGVILIEKNIWSNLIACFGFCFRKKKPTKPYWFEFILILESYDLLHILTSKCECCKSPLLAIAFEFI